MHSVRALAMFSGKYLFLTVLIQVITAIYGRSSHFRPQERIINGNVAVPHEAPYIVYMLATIDDEVAGCAGAILSKNYVLTAGHCLDGIDSLEMFFGVHNITNKSEPHRLEKKNGKYIVHKKFFRPKFNNDIAIVKLKTPLEFNEHIQPVKIPSRADASRTYENEIVRIYGWGDINDGTDDKPSNDSEILRYVDVPVISNEDCHKETQYLYDGNICTSGRGIKGGCHGDSGGPLIFNGTQIGIVSRGASDYCERGDASIFTRITYYFDWIEQNSDVRIE